MRRRWYVLGGAGAILAAAIITARGVTPAQTPEIATTEVRQQPFRRTVPAEGTLEARESTPLQVPVTVRYPLRIGWLATEGTFLEAGEVAVRLDATELEKRVQDLREQLAANDLKVERRRLQADTTLEQLRRLEQLLRQKVEYAEEFGLTDTTVFSRREILESEADRAIASERLENCLSKQQRERKLKATDLEILAIEHRKLQDELDTALQTLEALDLKAPEAGYLLYARHRGQSVEVGDTVFPGRALGEIPHDGPMEVDAYVLEADAGGLKPDRTAWVTIDAAPERRYDAHVISVDKAAKPRFRSSPVQYFSVKLALTETDREVMKPGLSVTVEILIDDIERALVVPRQALFQRDGAQVVYREQGPSFEPVSVTVRATGRGRAVVEGKLAAGDLVAVVDPLDAGGNGSTTPADSGTASGAVPSLGGGG